MSRGALRAAAGAAALVAAACARPGGVMPHAGGRTAGGIAWEVAGSGPAVVLISGSNLDRRVWDRQVPVLARRFTVVRYDLRAHGASADAPAAFSGVADLRELLDTLGLARARLVGLSYGTRVAVDFALESPGRVAALALISPTVSGYVATERPAWFGPILAALQAGQTDRAADLLADSPLMAVGPRDSALVGAMVRQSGRLFRQAGREPPSSAPAWGRLGDLAMPTLVITGAADGADILRVADSLAARAPRARQVRLAGAGHLVNLAAAERVNAELERFLRAVRD